MGAAGESSVAGKGEPVAGLDSLPQLDSSAALLQMSVIGQGAIRVSNYVSPPSPALVAKEGEGIFKFQLAASSINSAMR